MKAPPLTGRRTLCHVSDDDPGWSRRRAGNGFVYYDAKGRRIRGARSLARIRALVIPPAWRDVWICERSNGHLQATGRDERGRKQYLYHADFRRMRDEAKYDRLAAFADALPRIRQRVTRDLRRRGLDREKALATVVSLLEASLIRVGNESYYRENGSVGLSTMRSRHVAVRGDKVRFAFRGKSGRRHDVELTLPRVARIVRRLQDLPGQELFQYLDAEGVRCPVTSQAVNDYLHETAGDEFSAKDFRTWAGTVLAARTLHDHGVAENEREVRRTITTAVKQVAQRLGNTPAVCRQCYIHPAIMAEYNAGYVLRLPDRAPSGLLGRSGLNADERVVRNFLRRASVVTRPGRT